MAQTADVTLNGITYKMPPLSIGALEDGAFEIIGRIGSAPNTIAQARSMLELVVVATKAGHPDLTVDTLRESTTMSDFPALNEAVVKLLEISGMTAQEGDPAPGEAPAAS